MCAEGGESAAGAEVMPFAYPTEHFTPTTQVSTWTSVPPVPTSAPESRRRPRSPAQSSLECARAPSIDESPGSANNA